MYALTDTAAFMDNLSSQASTPLGKYITINKLTSSAALMDYLSS